MTTKQSHALVAVVAVAIGGWVGWQFHPNTELTLVALQQSASSKAEHAPGPEEEAPSPATPVPTKEEKSLDSLRKQLADAQITRQQLQAQVDDLLKQVAKLTPRADRYEYLEKMLTEGPSWGVMQLNLSTNDLKMSSRLSELLNLDSDKLKQVNAIGQDITKRVKDWETTQAVTVEETDTCYIYEIPPYPDDIQAEFRDALNSTLNEEDAALVSAMGKDFFKFLDEPRQISLEIEIAENGRERLKQTLSVVKDGESQMRNSSTTMSSSGYAGVQPRWQHLFQLDDPEESTSPAP